MIGMGIELRYMIFYAKPSPVTNPLVYSIDVLNHRTNSLPSKSLYCPHRLRARC